jgi:Rieske Fe-S protein
MLRCAGTTIAREVRSFDKERLVTTPNRQLPTVITLSSEQASEPSRRQFCAHACQAASLVAVSALLPACGGGGDSNPTNPSGGGGTTQALPVINGTVAGRTVSVSVSGSLANPSSAALVQANGVTPNVFLVFRDSTTAFTVLTAVCTHEGCTVDSFNGQLYTCPCHGSKYTTGGAVANGPANRNLTVFASTLSGTTLTFNV